MEGEHSSKELLQQLIADYSDLLQYYHYLLLCVCKSIEAGEEGMFWGGGFTVLVLEWSCKLLLNPSCPSPVTVVWESAIN